MKLSIFIVFLIIFIFAALANTGHPLQTLEKANIERVKVDIKTITFSLELFEAENHSTPSTKEGLNLLITNLNPDKYINWRQYIKNYPIDPWGNKYQYLNPGMRSEIDIYTFGPDGIQSEDDIGNWKPNY